MKNIAILGSTGSIGTQTLEIVRQNRDMRVTALSCNSNIDLLENQIREFSPNVVSVGTEHDAFELKKRIRDVSVKVYFGMDGLCEVARESDSNILVNALVGMIGVRPTYEAITCSKDIALANKETLVAAGDIIMREAKDYHVNIIPVDSEHSAIFQCLAGEKDSKVARIWLTASGGPFFGKLTHELYNVKAEDALQHPNWSMGAKITIDSATLVNKGLEIIEASHLFGVKVSDIYPVIERSSTVHSMVEFTDGSVKAQLGMPDMRLPIAYALTWPKRGALPYKPIDFYKTGAIEFKEPDRKTFKGIDIAVKAAEKGGSLPAVMNAANEIAVAKFLNNEIRFLQIYDIIEHCMSKIPHIYEPSLNQILEIPKKVRECVDGMSIY